MTVPVQNPFADPIQPPSVYPSQASLRGRLVLITPHKIETTPSNLNPGQMQERITADVTVVDGLGPVPDMKNNQHSGQWLDGPDFTGVWLSGQRVVDQLRSQIGTGQSVLGVIETYRPGQAPMKGNPWGILTATPEQKTQASQFLATRTVAAAAAPVPQPEQFQPQAAPPAQPQYTQQAAPPAPAPAAQPVAAPVQAPAPGVASTPAPGQAPAANPFLQQAPAQVQPVNPFLQNAPQQ